MSDTRPESHVMEWAFRRHYRGLHRFFLRRTRDPERAHDLAQQVFADAAEQLALRHADTRSTAWLYTVARRRLGDEARRSQRLPRLVPLSGSEPDRAAEPYGEDVGGAISAAIARLPQGQREVVVGKLLEGRSFAELGERLGTSEGAARMRFLRGLRALRDDLEAAGVEP